MEAERRCARCERRRDEYRSSNDLIARWLAVEWGDEILWLCPECMTRAERAASMTVSPGRPGDWADTLRTLLWTLATIGAVVVVAAVIEEGNRIGDLGWGGWWEAPISNADTAVVYAVVIGPIVVGIAAVRETLTRRRIRRLRIASRIAEDPGDED